MPDFNFTNVERDGNARISSVRVKHGQRSLKINVHRNGPDPTKITGWRVSEVGNVKGLSMQEDWKQSSAAAPDFLQQEPEPAKVERNYDERPPFWDALLREHNGDEEKAILSTFSTGSFRDYPWMADRLCQLAMLEDSETQPAAPAAEAEEHHDNYRNETERLIRTHWEEIKIRHGVDKHSVVRAALANAAKAVNDATLALG